MDNFELYAWRRYRAPVNWQSRSPALPNSTQPHCRQWSILGNTYTGHYYAPPEKAHPLLIWTWGTDLAAPTLTTLPADYAGWIPHSQYRDPLAGTWGKLTALLPFAWHELFWFHQIQPREFPSLVHPLQPTDQDRLAWKQLGIHAIWVWGSPETTTTHPDCDPNWPIWYTPHPRYFLTHPAAKKIVWAALRQEIIPWIKGGEYG